MTPNGNTVINLSELNQTIAQQRGVTVADLALADAEGNRPQVITESNDAPVLSAEQVAAGVSASNDGVITDEMLAAQYRSQADTLYKEAKALRAQAEELVPTIKKKTSKKTTESV